MEQIAREPYRTYFFPPNVYYRDRQLLSDLAAREQVDILQMNDLETLYGLGFPLALSNHTHLVYEAHYQASALARLLNVPDTRVTLARELERGMVEGIDALIVFTEDDAQRWTSAYQGLENKVFVVPFGTDIGAQRIAESSSYRSVFLGSMYFEPNARAVEWLCSSAFPKVRQTFPNADLLIVGDAPADLIRRFGSAAIKFAGEVEDLPGYIATGAVGLAPLEERTGVRVKILNYLASGLPVVATDAAAEGLRFPALFAEPTLVQFVDRWIALLGLDAHARHDLADRISTTLEILKRAYAWDSVARLANSAYAVIRTRPQFAKSATEMPSSEPIWLEEVVSKGRFGRNDSQLNDYPFGAAGFGQWRIFRDYSELNSLDRDAG